MGRRLRQLFVVNGLLLAGLAIILLAIGQHMAEHSALDLAALFILWLALLFWLAWCLADLVLHPLLEFAAQPPEKWNIQAPYPELLPFITAL